MKKFLSLVLTVCLALSLCAPALAAENTMSSFKKVTTYQNQFTDLTEGYWANSVVKLCYEYGFMKGDSPTRFNPQGELTLAEAIVMADRIHEIYTTGQSTLTNGEVWYQPYVDYALEKGIIAAGDFSNYTAKATRAQMAYIFNHALPASTLPGINNVISLPDVKSSTPYAQDIMNLYTAGVLTGNDIYGTFYPNNHIIRAEAAAILSRVALPTQRKQVVLMKQVSWDGNVTLAVPQSARTENGEGATAILSEQDQAGVILSANQDASYKGQSIAIFTAAEMNNLLKEGFDSTEMTLKSLASTLVSFGAIQAYRTTGILATEAGNAACVIYTYFSGDTMTMIVLMAYQSETTLQNMANGLQVAGCAVSPKL